VRIPNVRALDAHLRHATLLSVEATDTLTGLVVMQILPPPGATVDAVRAGTLLAEGHRLLQAAWSEGWSHDNVRLEDGTEIIVDLPR